ncbi:hypothetical protein CKAN_00016100 [Cinnamomum micranthum f. kanehirae]|uniref:Uncharacterized protein n=1 Tax=Cinnamomum micranthum f. kanehirae TaxID=337451 RepID=A0A443N0B6_9MAGN|nr:hypothetical protein CKAN_00016100 [Cinnamomum micranthum f. kanehirae]
MGRRRGRAIWFTPWTAFGCNLVYGNGFECPPESAPVAPRIACLGCGLKSLHQASQEVRQTNSAKILEAIILNRLMSILTGPVMLDNDGAGLTIMVPYCSRVFIDLPAIGKALAYAQKMLTDVDKGDSVDTKLLSEVHNFRFVIEFPELSHEEKSHVLLVHALKSQTKKFKSIVAIIDASGLGGLRKHWNTPVPQEIAELDEQYFTSFENDGEAVTWWRKMLEILLADKPVVAVGAGASAMLGASSLSKVVLMSTFMKLVTYKIPAFVKIGMVQTQRTAALALTKVLGPSKMVVPGLASSGVKTSALKVAASTEKIRVVAHSVIASVEHTSFQIMRTTFYEIMRRRRGWPIGFTPWTAFGCNVTTCAGLLVYGDGIECAAESALAAPRIACLGRGLKSLHQASQEVRQTNNAKIHEAIKSLMYSVKKIKHQ